MSVMATAAMSRAPVAAPRRTHNADVEREYDRLRDAARVEAEKRKDCYDRSHRAYENGDRARAKEISAQGKIHAARAKDLNRQASEYIFRERNAPGRIEPDCIDLHGQFAEEAERIVEQRILADQIAGRNYLHVIVGKGNHSANHVAKIKPKVEEICRQMGLKYHVEDNAGRIYINLQGGEAISPSPGGYGYGGHYGGQHQMEEEIEAPGSSVLQKLSNCCVVM